MMEPRCKNCFEVIDGNFCKNCGQKTATHRLSFHDALHELEHGILHFDRGIFFTLKELWMQPGTAIRNYINGHRIRYMAPVSMVFILGTVYGLLTHFLQLEIHAAVVIKSDADKNVLAARINEWIGSHYALITVASIPLQALATFLIFRKQSYNYMEHIVLNAFLSAQRLSWHIPMIPFLYLLKHSGISEIITSGMQVADVALLIGWGYLPFFQNIPKLKAVGLSLLSLMLQFLFVFIVVMSLAAAAVGLGWVH